MKSFNEITEHAKKISLTSKERELLRTHIESFVSDHPIKNTSVLSPYSAWFRLAGQHGVATALILIFCVFGVSSVSAEGTLPGDTLYGVKTGVNEKVLGWFAQSSDAKAQWQLSLADRRLEESETLAKENKLSPEIKASLQRSFTNNTNEALGVIESPDTSTQGSHPSVAPTRMMKALNASGEGNVPVQSGFSGTSTNTEEISRDQIDELRTKVKQIKVNMEKRKSSLVKNHQFIQTKGQVLMTQKAIFDSAEALKGGDTHHALELYKQAQSELEHATLVSQEDNLSGKESSSLIQTQSNDSKIQEEYQDN